LRSPFASSTRSPSRGPRRDADARGVVARVGRLVLGEELLVALETRPALRLPRAGREPHPLELARQRPPAGRLLLLLVGEALLLLIEPRRVVSLPRDAEAAVELEDPAGDVVEKVAVVGDGDDRPGVLLEVALEPRHRFRVEVVGRLVEEQQVGLPEEDLAERDAPALATGERPDVGVAGGQPQRVHGDLEVPVELPSVGGIDGALRVGLLRQHLLHGGVVEGLAEAHRQLLEAREERPGRCDRLLDVLEHGLRRIEHGLLRQQPDGDAIARQRVAGEIGIEAGHDAEQCALPRAVGADHADLGAVVEGERDALEDLLALRGDLPDLSHGVDEARWHGGRV
jgi:hypothetical protein